mgnify:CR=1 FL=1
MSVPFQIISDSSCDLSPEVVRENNIHVVPFYVSPDGGQYYKEGVEIGVREFYQQLVDHPGVFPKSSMPSVQDYINAFTPYVEQGIPVVCVCITTKFSGSYNSATNAAELVKEDHPDAKIAVINSMVNTVLQGLFTLELVRMRDAGVSFEKAIRLVKLIRPSARIFFTIASMDYLLSGGRVGKLAGSAATALKLKPMIVLKEGEIFPTGITRNREKSMEKLVSQTRNHFEKAGESPDDYSLCVGFGYDRQEAERFRDKLVADMKKYSHVTDIPLFQIGATIAVHTGPHPLGVGLIKRYNA